MNTVTLSGNDSTIIDNIPLTDLADGDCTSLTFPNDIASLKTGKNGNSVYSLNESGNQAEMKVRVLRGSSDDKRLNAKMVQQQANFAGTVLMQGEFVKKLGDGLGNVTSDTYITSGGIFTKRVEAKTNTDGDTEQSVAIYTIKFSNAPRILT